MPLSERRSPGLKRRDVLLAAATSLLAWPAAAQIPRRIAVMDWAMLETLMALGVTPIAATELIQFRKTAMEPVIPPQVVDLGLRGSPNFELLHLLKPDLILISPFYARYEASLARIAPTLSLPFYTPGEPPFEKSLAAVTALGRALGRDAEARAVLEQCERDLARMREALSGHGDRPTYLVNIGDARHVRIFGADSMFGDMLSRLGLPNAWTDRSRFTFAAPVPIEDLAARDDARIVIVSDIPVEARSDLRQSMIWKSLPAVQQDRVIMLDNINPYGGITAGMRFARLLSQALLSDGGKP